MPHSPAATLPLFSEAVQRSLRQLPVIGAQSDITYYSTHARSILNDPGVTGMGFWSINPYIGCAFGCAYCYARYAHRYVMERASAADRLVDSTAEQVERIPPWLAFERHIFVKRNAGDTLARTLRHGSDKHLALLEGEAIVIGTATDPYQPAERHFKVTRGILEVLAEHPGLRVVIITKSALITRDVALLARIARISTLSVHLSLITLDRALARRLEPRAARPDRRLEAMATVAAAGVPVGVMIGPVIPGLNDAEIPRILAAAARAGAQSASWVLVRLAKPLDELFDAWLATHYPERRERVLARIRDTRGGQISDARFFRRQRGQGEYADQIASLFEIAARKYGLDRRLPSLETDAFRRPPRPGDQIPLL